MLAGHSVFFHFSITANVLVTVSIRENLFLFFRVVTLLKSSLLVQSGIFPFSVIDTETVSSI